MESIIILALIIGLVVGIVIYTQIQARKRREAWQETARTMNFTYRESDGTHDRFSQFKIFGLGHSRESVNILVGKNDTDEIRTLDYKYTTGSGKHKHTYFQTLCLVQSKGLNVPQFFVRRECAIYDFLGKLFGGQDINFPEDQAFSKAFVLQGASEPAVRELFDARIRRLFLQFEGTNMQIEGKGDTILFNPTEYVQPEKVGSLIAKAINVKKAFAPEQEP